MNIFQIIFLDVVLLVFPIFIYLIYLSCDNTIKDKTKNMYLSLMLITSFFMMYNYGVNTPLTVPILVLNSAIILSYLTDKYILANMLAITIMIIYMNNFNFIWMLSVMYIVMLIIYLFKKKINDVIFVILEVITSSIMFTIWLYIFNNNYYNLKSLTTILISYIFISCILCFLYAKGKNILSINTTLKELQKEKQIRLSLFKITHEIKNPIAVCKGYLDMINVHDESQVERFIPIIKSEIERLLSLLQDFLSINKSNLDLDVMDLNMLIEDTLKTTNSIISNKNIELKLNMVDDEIYINGDYNRLNQVILNILKNSIESIPKEKTGIINISTIIEKNNYKLIIEDNGIGMSREVLNKMKEPFFTTKKRGSGLGIPLIYEIVEAHDSKINYTSKEGIGTKVTIEFPKYKF